MLIYRCRLRRLHTINFPRGNFTDTFFRLLPFAPFNSMNFPLPFLLSAGTAICFSAIKIIAVIVSMLQHFFRRSLLQQFCRHESLLSGQYQSDDRSQHNIFIMFHHQHTVANVPQILQSALIRRWLSR